MNIWSTKHQKLICLMATKKLRKRNKMSEILWSLSRIIALINNIENTELEKKEYHIRLKYPKDKRGN